MDRENRYKEIVDKYGKEYIYRQLAEECSELAQACLKAIRADRRETPMRKDEAWERLLEEVGDVCLMIDILTDMFFLPSDIYTIAEISERKEKRMYERMLDDEMEDDVW